MNFKEWLANEARFKGLKRAFRSQYPDMPNYVANDIYNSRVGWMMGQAYPKNTEMAKSTSPVSQSPFNNSSGLTNQIFDKAGMNDIQWTKKPEILMTKGQPGVTPLSFDRDTQYRFLHRRFGFKEVAVRNDAQRMATQKNLMNTRGEGRNEPILVIEEDQGYKLLEGWHRTMNYLLKGAPTDQFEMLKQGTDLSQIRFEDWRPIQIMGYIGRGPKMQAAYAGTGSYE